jgi:hypothetical protein
MQGIVQNKIKVRDEWEINNCNIGETTPNFTTSVKKKRVEGDKLNCKSGVDTPSSEPNKEIIETIKRNLRDQRKRKITTHPPDIKTKLSKENERLIRIVSSWL